jgi:D-glycero-D-manno-heptose 1,7-bisphosphate phosphatase
VTARSRSDLLQRAAFLDRDGVLNCCEVRDGKPFAPRTLADFRLLPGVRAAVERLKSAGLLVVVVTNQPDIGNGLVDPATVQEMHQALRRRVPVDDVLICPHAQHANCGCRKPKPGMLLEAARRWHIDLQSSFMVGDRASDIVAGQAVGCYTLFLDRGYAEPRPGSADQHVKNLRCAADVILARLESGDPA